MIEHALENQTEMRLEGCRVVLVEDNAALAENVRDILAEEGAEVRIACTGAEAVRCADHGFDVALVDVKLPDGSGLPVLSQLKERGDRLGEVLLMTGYGSLEDAIEALRRGAYAYVLKPFSPDELVRGVQLALRQVVASRRGRLLAHKLEQREASLRTLVNTVQALLLVLDEEGRVVQANPAVAAATGASTEDLIGAPWVDRFVPAADRPGVNAAFARLRAGEPTIAYENRIVSRGEDGAVRDRWVRWHASRHPTGNGEVWIYASGLDSTELRDLERRTGLSERLAAVGTLTAGLAHEVRNPLNAAQLQLDLLERRLARLGASEERQVTEPLRLVRQEIARLADLVDEFLKFARPPGLVVGEVEVGALARDVVESERPEAASRNIDLRLEEREPCVVIRADPSKLRQVLINLVRNALEAVGHGGQVVVGVERDGEGCLVRVRDNGPGIAAEHLPHIFEPFFSTKPGGTGLGMSICHSLLRQHGGDVRVVHGGDSAFATEFEVALPAHPPGEHAAGEGGRRAL